MTAPTTRKGPLKCPECGQRLDYGRDPHGRVYQCINMECLQTFTDDDDLGDDPVATTAALLGESVEIIRDYVRCGKALETSDRSCAREAYHRGDCAPRSHH